MNVVFALLKTQKSIMKLTSKSSILQYLIEHLNNNGHPIDCVTVGGDDITPCITNDCWLRVLCCFSVFVEILCQSGFRLAMS